VVVGFALLYVTTGTMLGVVLMEYVGCGWIVTVVETEKKIGRATADEEVELVGVTGVPSKYCEYWLGGKVASFGGRLIMIDGGITLCSSVKVAVVGSTVYTVTAQNSIMVITSGGILIVVVIV
jgi:hypothetical protein